MKVLALLGLLMLPTLGQADTVPKPMGWQWLSEVAKAHQQLSYSGQFIYTKGAAVETMTIDHTVKDGVPIQRLASLGDFSREIIKDENSVACYLPDKKMGVREVRRDEKKAFPMVQGDAKQLETHYSLAILNTSEIAGRSCQNLRVTPRDDLRYGYLLCVDTHKYLPLKSVMIDMHGKAIETQMFISITFAEGAADMQPKTSAASLEWKNEQPVPAMADDQDLAGVGYPLAVKGFQLIHSLRRKSPTLDKEIRHLVLSDGLASVSIFIVPVHQPASSDDAGKEMGAVNSYARMVGKHKIIALGEVPYKTVQLLVQAVHSS